MSLGSPNTGMRRFRGIERPYILFVGSIEPRKNIHTMVRAYAKARNAAGTDHSLGPKRPEGHTKCAAGWQIAPSLRELGTVKVPQSGATILHTFHPKEELDTRIGYSTSNCRNGKRVAGAILAAVLPGIKYVYHGG